MACRRRGSPPTRPAPHPRPPDGGRPPILDPGRLREPSRQNWDRGPGGRARCRQAHRPRCDRSPSLRRGFPDRLGQYRVLASLGPREQAWRDCVPPHARSGVMYAGGCESGYDRILDGQGSYPMQSHHNLSDPPIIVAICRTGSFVAEPPVTDVRYAARSSQGKASKKWKEDKAYSQRPVFSGVHAGSMNERIVVTDPATFRVSFSTSGGIYAALPAGTRTAAPSRVVTWISPSIT